MLIYQVINGLRSDWAGALLMLLALILTILPAIMIHELAHGLAAYLNGDFTAKLAGRLTLDPRKHFDILGTIMMLVVGFGWAKPVPVDSRNFRNYKKGMLTTALAGVTANLIMALIAFVSLCALTAIFASSGTLVATENGVGIYTQPAAAYNAYRFFYYWCTYGVTVNMTLFLFNLVPLYPLDGFRVVETLAKPDNAFVRFNYRYGNFLLIGVILIFTVFGYIASYIGVNIDIFSRWQGLFIDLIKVVQSAIVGGA